MQPLIFSYQLSPTFCCLIVTLLAFTLFMKHQRIIHNYEKPKLPPGPTPWPIVGNIPEMLANRTTFRWIQKIMNDMNKNIACIRLGRVHVILVSDSTISRELCVK
ncbi:unnamed protein product [Lathyrus sativus]|nr:unnamed protein product [Lathyrus sativus]